MPAVWTYPQCQTELPSTLTRRRQECCHLSKTLHDSPKKRADHSEANEKTSRSCGGQSLAHADKVSGSDHASDREHHLFNIIEPSETIRIGG